VLNYLDKQTVRQVNKMAEEGPWKHTVEVMMSQNTVTRIWNKRTYLHREHAFIALRMVFDYFDKKGKSPSKAWHTDWLKPRVRCIFFLAAAYLLYNDDTRGRWTLCW